MMKMKYIWLCLALAIAVDNQAQQIVSCEYFFDTDPGIDNGIPISVAPGDSVIFSGTIPTSSLNSGFHKLFVRAKNSNGTWSLYEGRTFYIQGLGSQNNSALTEAEYFYDDDPGVGNGIDLPTNINDSLQVNTTVPTSSLTTGFHKLFVRAKNAQGAWSLYEGRTFYIQAQDADGVDQITAAEYFYDTDPGIGNGDAFAVIAADSLVLNTSVSTVSLSDGFHKLFVRAQNNLGKWSLYEGRTVYLQSETSSDSLTIVAAEYFFDTEPGLGLATPLSIIPGDSIDATFDVPQSLPVGIHTMYIRCKSSNGDWGLFEARTLDVSVGIDEYEVQQNVLFQNYPNPIVSQTIIEFVLAKPQPVLIQVTDLSGKLIRDIQLDTLNSGKHRVELDITDLTDGYYLYRLVAPEFISTKQMIVMK
jgi:Secretion system C-terminal sorting domain